MTFARQSLGSLAVLVFGVAVSVLLPRILGAEARGEYQLAVKLAGLVLAVAQWGIPEVLLQLMAEGRARTGALIGTSLTLGLAGAAVIAALLGIAAPLFKDNLLRGVDPLLLWLTLGGSLASLVGLLARRFIQLDGRLDLYNALDVGRTALFLVLILITGSLLPRQAFVVDFTKVEGLAFAVIGDAHAHGRRPHATDVAKLGHGFSPCVGLSGREDPAARLAQASANALRLTTMRLSTLVTPGARHAARSASSRSAQERTLPLRITSLPLASTCQVR